MLYDTVLASNGAAMRPTTFYETDQPAVSEVQWKAGSPLTAWQPEQARSALGCYAKTTDVHRRACGYDECLLRLRDSRTCLAWYGVCGSCCGCCGMCPFYVEVGAGDAEKNPSSSVNRALDFEPVVLRSSHTGDIATLAYCRHASYCYG